MWNLPHRYDAFPAFLVARGLLSAVRIEVVVTVLVFGASPVLFQLGEGADADRSSLVIAALMGAFGVLWAVLFARSYPWLSRRMSLMFVASTCVSVVVSAFLMPIPYLGLAQCTGFCGLAGYVAFFHDPRVFLGVFGFSMATVGVVAIGEVQDGASILQIASLSGVVIVIVGTVPVMTSLVFSLMAPDAQASQFDELTDALNRRGLNHALRRLVRDGITDITVFALDLDSFKSINDTHGHSTGDGVLVAVTTALRKAAPDAAVARVGGEEFVVVRPAHTPDPRALAERLLIAVKTSSHPSVTASIGVAACTLTPTSNNGVDASLVELDRLITSADDAMYLAKNAGGDRVHIGS